MQLGYRVEKFATGLRGGCGIFAETNSAILWKKNISPDMSMNMNTSMNTSMNIRANAVTPMPSTTTTTIMENMTTGTETTTTIMENTTTGTETTTIITETTTTITIIMERVAIGS